MQKLTQWILLLLALVTASGLSGAWTSSASRQGSQQRSSLTSDVSSRFAAYARTRHLAAAALVP